MFTIRASAFHAFFVSLTSSTPNQTNQVTSATIVRENVVVEQGSLD